jgi:hypothetical protein
VELNFGNSIIEVGELALDTKSIFFKFYEEFLDKKIEISPFKLKT